MSDTGLWLPSPQRLPDCGVTHGATGRLDESAKRLDHPELAVAWRLVVEGHEVVTLADRGRREPVADLVVCGRPVEVKCLLRMDERDDGRRAHAATVHNRLASAVRQAAVVVVSTEGSGCREADAAAGLQWFAASAKTGRVAAVRILGDGFDLGWVAPLTREAAVGARRSRSEPPILAPEPAPEPGPARPAARARPGREVGLG